MALYLDLDDVAAQSPLAMQELASLLSENARLSAELADARTENKTLRGLLGHSSNDCQYCGLPAADQAQCSHGFPGCMRADDQQLGKYFAAGYEVECLRKELAEAKSRADHTVRQWDAWHRARMHGVNTGSLVCLECAAIDNARGVREEARRDD